MFEQGSIYSPSVLDITEEDLLTKVKGALANITAVSLTTHYPIEVCSSPPPRWRQCSLFVTAALSDGTRSRAGPCVSLPRFSGACPLISTVPAGSSRSAHLYACFCSLPDTSTSTVHLLMLAGPELQAAVPHLVINGFKNVLAIAIGTNYSFPQADKVLPVVALMVLDISVAR